MRARGRQLIVVAPLVVFISAGFPNPIARADCRIRADRLIVAGLQRQITPGVFIKAVEDLSGCGAEVNITGRLACLNPLTLGQSLLRPDAGIREICRT